MQQSFTGIRTVLISAIVVLTCADHLTTWLCLSQPVSGWTVTEANPVADLLFQGAGLVPGLLIDSLVTVAALTFLASTSRFTPQLKAAMLAFITIVSGYAVLNNVFAIADLGIGPFGA
jgi:uncharacterized protein YacL